MVGYPHDPEAGALVVKRDVTGQRPSLTAATDRMQPQAELARMISQAHGEGEERAARCTPARCQDQCAVHPAHPRLEATDNSPSAVTRLRTLVIW